jgi:hypothetical protein
MAARRRLGSIAAAALAAAAVVAGAAGVIMAWAPQPGTATATDLAGRPARLDPADQPSAAVLEQMDVVDTTTTHLRVPAVGLDTPVGELNVIDHQITPPGFSSVYRVRNLGVPLTDAAAGTVYVVTHSLRGGGLAPGNYLFDVATGKPRVTAGERISIGGLRYTVDQAQVVPKAQLPAQRDVWQNTPARLVLITCLQNGQNKPSTSNVVITATLA